MNQSARQDIEQMARAAGQAANAGRWEEAELIWRAVHAQAPEHPQALYSLGVHAMQRREIGEARDWLLKARAAAPRDPIIALTLAVACRESGDLAAEREAIEASLAIDAYFLPGLLARAGWCERAGQAVAAAENYKNALKIAPPQPHWPEALRPQLIHASQVVARQIEALSRHFDDRLAALQDKLPAHLQGRWREAASIMSGAARPYLSDSNQLCVPRLPAIPFFDREQFPWAGALEARTDAIRGELEAALAAEREKFNPYIAYRPGDPVNQWRDLNHSDRWSAYQLYRGGQPVAENLARCPQTAAALDRVEMAEIGGLCPNAMFSALAPKTHIPPHHGETNARLVVHLPLIVPPGCTYRVGFERRQWRVGEILVFDDTIEHEARNDGEELRVVLIFDVWNPLIIPEERAMVQALAAAAREFKALHNAVTAS